MTTPIVRPSNPPQAPIPNPLQEAIGQALPEAAVLLATHRDYDGRGLLVLPLDHFENGEDCKRFMIR